jgi:hypothetical protein
VRTPGGIAIATNGSPADFNENLANRFSISLCSEKNDENPELARAEFRESGGIGAVVNKGATERPSQEQFAVCREMFQTLHWAVCYIQFLEECGIISFPWSTVQETVTMLAKGMKPFGSVDMRTSDQLYAYARVHHLTMIVVTALFTRGGSDAISRHASAVLLPKSGMVGRHAVAWHIFQAVRLFTGPSQPLTVRAFGALLPHTYDIASSLIGPFATRLFNMPRVQSINSVKLDDSDMSALPYVRCVSALGSTSTGDTADPAPPDAGFGGFGGGGDSVCFGCGQPGHTQSQCPSTGPSAGQPDYDYIETGRTPLEFREWLCSTSGMSTYQVAKAVCKLQTSDRMQFPHRTGPVYNMKSVPHEVREAHPIDVRMAPSARRKTVVLLVEYVLRACRELPRALLRPNSEGTGLSLPNNYLALRPNQTLRNHYAKVVAEVLRPDLPSGASYDHGGSPVTEVGTYYAMPEPLCPEVTVAQCQRQRVPVTANSLWSTRSSFHLLSAGDRLMMGQDRARASLPGADGADSLTNADEAAPVGSAHELYVKDADARHPKAVRMHSAHAVGCAIANGTLHLISPSDEQPTVLMPPHPAACIEAAARSECPLPKRYPVDFLVTTVGERVPSKPIGRGWLRGDDTDPARSYNLPEGFVV